MARLIWTHRTGPFDLGTGIGGVGLSGTPDAPREGFLSATYEMNSSGPDRRENTSGTGNNPNHHWNWSYATANGYPGVHIPADDLAAIAEMASLIYDFTNGTVDEGGSSAPAA